LPSDDALLFMTSHHAHAPEAVSLFVADAVTDAVLEALGVVEDVPEAAVEEEQRRSVLEVSFVGAGGRSLDSKSVCSEGSHTSRTAPSNGPHSHTHATGYPRTIR
jgi:hypothetical protein